MDRLIVLALAFVFVFALIVVSFALGLIYRRFFGYKIWVGFLTRTGYRRQADPKAPIDEQARAVIAEIFRPEGVVRGPWVREVEGQELTYRSWMHQEDDAMVTEESWMLEMPAEAAERVQVLERRLAQPGLRERLTSKALGRERRWGAFLSHELRTGDPAFDARFLVLGDRAGAVPRYLQDPALRQWIAALPEACLFIAERWVALDDPAGALRRRHVGLTAVTPAQMMEREPPLHEQVAQTLAAISRAVRRAG